MSNSESIADKEHLIILKNNSSGVQLFTQLRRLKDLKQFVDVTLMSNDGDCCRVHACVVAAQSDFLQQSLSQQSQPHSCKTEDGTIEEQPVTLSKRDFAICLGHLSSEVLHACVQYMYGEDLALFYEELNDLAVAANMLKLKNLESLCREILSADAPDDDKLSFEVAKSKVKQEVNDTLVKVDIDDQTAKIVSTDEAHKMEIDIYERFSDQGNSTDSSMSKESIIGTEESTAEESTAEEKTVYLSTPKLLEEVVLYYDKESGKLEVSKELTNSLDAELDPVVLALLNEQFLDLQKPPAVRKQRKKQSEKKAVAKKRNATSITEKAERRKMAVQKWSQKKKLEKNKEYICNECGLKCIGRYKLDAHIMIVHKRQHVCKYCDRSFYQRGALAAHVARHEKKYQKMCDKCDYQCYSSSDLGYHIDTVHNPQMHQCSKCPAQYPSKSALRCHERSHDEPLKCDECDFATTYPFKLRRHKEEEHSNNIAECTVCGKVFRGFHNARKHQRKAHPDLVGIGTGLELSKSFPIQDYRYGSVEDNAYNPKICTSQKCGDGIVNPLIKRSVLNDSNECSISTDRAGNINSKHGKRTPKGTSSGAMQPGLETSNLDSQDFSNVDLKDVTLELVTDTANINEELNNVIYIEAGTGRIVSEEEVLSGQLQVVDAHESELVFAVDN